MTFASSELSAGTGFARWVSGPTALRLARVGFLFILLFFALGCDRDHPPAPPTTNPDEQPQRLRTATIRVGNLPLVVEVADDEATRQKGMMFRPRLGPDEAMLFVFPSEANLSFWMKNTYVDLDLAYIRADGAVAQTVRMRALVTEPVSSREPVRFVLEVPAGWFAKHGVGEGTKVAIPPPAEPAP